MEQSELAFDSLLRRMSSKDYQQKAGGHALMTNSRTTNTSTPSAPNEEKVLPTNNMTEAGTKVIRSGFGWRTDQLGIPSMALRSALFSVSASGRYIEGKASRRHCDSEKILATKDYEITYTGLELCQYDLFVWENIIDVGKRVPLGEFFKVTSYQILKERGIADTGPNRAALHRSIMRLMATSLCIKIGSERLMGGLLSSDAKSKDGAKTTGYTLALSESLGGIFVNSQITLVDRLVRVELKGSPGASWLFGYFSSHRNCYPISVERLYELSGSKASCMRDFKRSLKSQLERVRLACAKNGITFSYYIDKRNLVHTSWDEPIAITVD